MKSEICNLKSHSGSALILVIVLTSLIAIIASMFLLSSRVDSLSTTAVSNEKDLNAAIEAVLGEISSQLVLDVPGIAGEYYDYPSEEDGDPNTADGDPWLASLEPYEKTSDNYYWRHISDLYDAFNIDEEKAVIIPEYQNFSGSDLQDRHADADGDGVADSRWTKIPALTTGKGKPIYAAIRIIDNGGMLNVNTAYKFNANSSDSTDIDGSSLMQINLAALTMSPDIIDEIDNARNPQNKPFSDYQSECIWKIVDPCSDYSPFDISDELELRNRYFLTTLGETRLESVWSSTIGHQNFKRVPYNGKNGYDEDHWWKAIAQDANQPDRRHFLTTYNMDRIIDPNGRKMVNVNRINEVDDVNTIELYDTLVKALDPCMPDADKIAAQITVNLIDYIDNDSNIYVHDFNNVTYYGFESPCIYISEISHKFEEVPILGGPVPGLFAYHRTYAVELYKPYFEDADPNDDWQLVIDSGGTRETVDIDWGLGSRRFHVIRWEGPNTPDLPVNFSDTEEPNNPADYGYNPGDYSLTPQIVGGKLDTDEIFDGDSIIELQRKVNGKWLVADMFEVPGFDVGTGWLIDKNDPNGHSVQRDITRHKNIRRLLSGGIEDPDLGSHNFYENGDSTYIQAHPIDTDFNNIGQIGMVFRKAAYTSVTGIYPPDIIGYGDTEADVFVNLTNADFQNIFKYLTVFDPTTDGINNDSDQFVDEDDNSEIKIPGRININTAPWFVIAQLPWVTDELAQAIVAYRDEETITGGPDYSGRSGTEGFKNIGQLNNVVDGLDEYTIASYARDSNDLGNFPDLSDSDKAIDDFEERDVIFTRISNLVTVRSDVFTAYILVRLGTDGPQKRVIVILDRSDVTSASGKIKLRALHPVPDPR